MTGTNDYSAVKSFLLGRKIRLWDELKREHFDKLGKEYSEQFSSPQDMEDLSILDLIEDTGIKLAEVKQKELIQIEDALVRLDEGTYGLCEDCGHTIAKERLDAVPFATRCVACQSKKE